MSASYTHIVVIVIFHPKPNDDLHHRSDDKERGVAQNYTIRDNEDSLFTDWTELTQKTHTENLLHFVVFLVAIHSTLRSD